MGCLDRRSKLEIILMVSTIIFLLSSIGLLIGLIEEVKKESDSSSSNSICETQECLFAAAELQKSLNLAANPCEDFYEYACGGWRKNNVIPPDKFIWSQFEVAKQKVNEKLRVLLEGEYEASSPAIIGQTLDLYKKCMDLEKRESERYDELKFIINETKWPMIDKSFNGQTYSWSDVYSKLNREYGFNFILTNLVNLDAKNTKIYSIYVDSPTFGVGRAQLMNPNTPENKRIIDSYKEFIRNSAILLADPPLDMIELEVEIEELLEFEKKLANISADSASRRDRENFYGKKTNISEFMLNYNDIPLLSIEEVVFKGHLDKEISSSSELIVYDRDYFKELGDIIMNETNKTLANYLSWRLVQSLGSYTTKAFRNLEFEYNRVVSGVQEPKPMWEDCIDTVNNRLPFAVGRIYVNGVNFTKEGKTDLNDKIDLLEEAFEQLLKDNDWMKMETKEKALEKLKEMLRAIAFPDFIVNDVELMNYYSGLDLKKNSTYFQSLQTHSSWANIKSLKRLANNVTLNRTELEWTTGPAVVNAFFSANINRITFPAGILQSPFYTLGVPAALNLGAIGFVIGHEITHSFDDSGSQFDKYGNLLNWWDNSTREKFNEKVECFVNQYNEYMDPVVGMPVNGRTTIGENIADNGGLRQAFSALQNFKGNNELLPASMKRFTREQLFFLSFANVWCNNIRREALKNQIELDNHSPSKYRVWGSVSNLEGFAKAFNCNKSSNMTRETNCILW